MRAGLWVVIGLVAVVGCGQDHAPAGSGAKDAEAAATGDPFAAALQEAEPGEGAYIEAARPFLGAVAGGDYAAVHAALSSHARARLRPNQFVPSDDDEKPADKTAIKDLTLPKCAEWMKKMEATLGVPEAVQSVYVQSLDPAVLAGKGEPLDVMLAIGNMPPEIPVGIRKASIRAQVRCQLPEAEVKKIAADLKISEQQVRSGAWPENDLGYDSDERPYLNVKFVLVEEDGKLKVGYFEFMPPSILD